MGTVSLTLPSDGTVADVADVNVPFNQLATVINGNLDNTNISSSGISGTKIQTGTLPGTALDSTAQSGWQALGATPNTVTANGNRSYTLVFNGADYTSKLSPGMRLRTTRANAAPTQCATLNGTSQYFSKTSPAGMAFTDDFVAGGWIKLSSYPTSLGTIQSRYNGTSGWYLAVGSDGTLVMKGFNSGSSNVSQVSCYQSIPLNKWVHVAAQLDMSSFTASTTTSYIMIDCVDVPVTVNRSGTNPTALLQAGNYEIGSQNSGLLPFPGKIAQPFLFSAKVTESTIQSYYSQGLAGTETNLISAYSFSNSLNDLNTTNANNLTNNNGASITTADAPWGGQAGGAISSTLDYGVIQSISYSTNTTVIVQVPEGCTIPTSGGVSSVVYSSVGVPYGFPKQKAKWTISTIVKPQYSQASAVAGTWYNLGSTQIIVPVGEWDLVHSASPVVAATTNSTLSETLSTANNSESNTEFTAEAGIVATNSGVTANVYRRRPVSITTQIPYYLNIRQSGGTSVVLFSNNVSAAVVVEAENAYI
jgi:hypothetical protein